MVENIYFFLPRQGFGNRRAKEDCDSGGKFISRKIFDIYDLYSFRPINSQVHFLVLEGVPIGSVSFSVCICMYNIYVNIKLTYILGITHLCIIMICNSFALIVR